MAKPILKQKAQHLRTKGVSIKEIANRLNVSPSSASIWCREIILTRQQILTLEKHARDPFYGKRLLNIRRQQRDRIKRTNKLLDEGIRQVGVLNKRALFASGVALYWAEGFKKDNQVGFANSDPDMIKFFLKWLFDCFGYTLKDVTIRISANISHKKRIDDIHLFWATVTKIPLSEFRKPFFQNVEWKKRYKHPERYYGVARIRVRKSTDFLRKIHGFIEGLKKNTL